MFFENIKKEQFLLVVEDLRGEWSLAAFCEATFRTADCILRLLPIRSNVTGRDWRIEYTVFYTAIRPRRDPLKE